MQFLSGSGDGVCVFVGDVISNRTQHAFKSITNIEHNTHQKLWGTERAIIKHTSAVLKTLEYNRTTEECRLRVVHTDSQQDRIFNMYIYIYMVLLATTPSPNTRIH